MRIIIASILTLISIQSFASEARTSQINVSVSTQLRGYHSPQITNMVDPRQGRNVWGDIDQSSYSWYGDYFNNPNVSFGMTFHYSKTENGRTVKTPSRGFISVDPKVMPPGTFNVHIELVKCVLKNGRYIIAPHLATRVPGVSIKGIPHCVRIIRK